MISSMTGFAAVDWTFEGNRYRIEVRTLNHRYQETRIRAPRSFGPLESRIRKMMGGAFRRGRIEVYITLVGPAEGAGPPIEPNLERARGLAAALERIRRELEIPEPIRLETLLSFGDVVVSHEAEADESAVWSALEPALREVSESAGRMRQAEGEAIESDLRARLDQVAAWVEKIRTWSLGQPERLRERLEARVKAVETTTELDPWRFNQEVLYIIERADVSEELVRLDSHLKQFDRLLTAEEGVGRKLDFLTQELLREVNTIGSKAADADVAQWVVELKFELEKIREQIQNVE